MSLYVFVFEEEVKTVICEKDQFYNEMACDCNLKILVK